MGGRAKRENIPQKVRAAIGYMLEQRDDMRTAALHAPDFAPRVEAQFGPAASAQVCARAEAGRDRGAVPDRPRHPRRGYARPK